MAAEAEALAMYQRAGLHESGMLTDRAMGSKDVSIARVVPRKASVTMSIASAEDMEAGVTGRAGSTASAMTMTLRGSGVTPARYRTVVRPLGKHAPPKVHPQLVNEDPYHLSLGRTSVGASLEGGEGCSGGWVGTEGSRELFARTWQAGGCGVVPPRPGKDGCGVLSLAPWHLPCVVVLLSCAAIGGASGRTHWRSRSLVGRGH